MMDEKEPSIAGVMFLIGSIPYVLVALGAYFHVDVTGHYGNDANWMENSGAAILGIGSLVLLPLWPVFAIFEWWERIFN